MVQIRSTRKSNLADGTYNILAVINIIIIITVILPVSQNTLEQPCINTFSEGQHNTTNALKGISRAYIDNADILQVESCQLPHTCASRPTFLSFESSTYLTLCNTKRLSNRKTALLSLVLHIM